LDSQAVIKELEKDGCVPAGKTIEEARRMAAEALVQHIEGMVEDGEEIPTPSTLDALADDPAMTGAVAFLVALQPPEDKTVRVNILQRVRTRSRR
jgi:predicted RNase H-like HicB family nuclease